MVQASHLGSLIMKSTVLLFVASVFITSQALAENSPNYNEQCANIVKECFASSQADSSSCFFTASRHPFCDGTELGKLTNQRWAMSPNKPGGMEAAPAFLGPRLIDGECLKNFDAEWTSALVKDDLTNKRISELTESLQGCARDVSNELMRP